MISEFKRLFCAIFAFTGLALFMLPANAGVTFSGATATFNQTFDQPWLASDMIDGDTGQTNSGWAIYQDSGSGDQTLDETALLELATPLATGPTKLTFNLYQLYGRSHLIGDFSLAYTTSASPTLTSAQTPLTLTGETSMNGAMFTSPAAGQLVVGGSLPDTDVYTITASVDAPITGIFLDAINDPSNGLPTGGPGGASNGNFVITQFTASASAVPEPSTWALMLVGFAGLVAAGSRFRAGRRNVVSAA